MTIRRIFILLGVILLPAVSPGLTIYRIELAGGGVVFAESEPRPSGGTIVFRSSPQGILVALRRSEVAGVEQIEADNKPPVDLGNATLKRQAAPMSPRLPAQRGGGPISDNAPAWALKMKTPGGFRGYPQGDDQPGRSVAFPVSRDDLLPGNYRPFPAGRGGQVIDLPMIQEGRGVPKAGSLQEPPKAIELPNPPSSSNIQVPTSPLIYSEKPKFDESAPAPRGDRKPS